MRPFRHRILLLAALTLLLTACHGAVAPALRAIPSSSAAISTPTAIVACRSVSALQPNASMGGYALARAGPLWFSAFGRVRSGPAVIVDAAPGGPTKVVIRPDPDLHETVELRGTACDDGSPLRFCYRGACGLTGQPVSPAVLQQRGVAVLSVSPGLGDYTGYMLFPRAGEYRLVVTAGDRELGEAVLLVPSGPLPDLNAAPAATAQPTPSTSSEPTATATPAGDRAALAQRPLHLPALEFSACPCIRGPAQRACRIQSWA